jgi:hypothetical protein
LMDTRRGTIRNAKNYHHAPCSINGLFFEQFHKIRGLNFRGLFSDFRKQASIF